MVMALVAVGITVRARHQRSQDGIRALKRMHKSARVETEPRGPKWLRDGLAKLDIELPDRVVHASLSMMYDQARISQIETRSGCSPRLSNIRGFATFNPGHTQRGSIRTASHRGEMKPVVQDERNNASPSNANPVGAR